MAESKEDDYVSYMGQRFPAYELFLIVVGPVVLLLIWLLFQKTRWGTLVRAARPARTGFPSAGSNAVLPKGAAAG